MRGIIDFYRRHPWVLVVALVLGVGTAVITTTVNRGDGVVLPIAAVAVIGLIVGTFVGAIQRRD